MDGVWELEFDIPVSLWWPRSYGSQKVYSISAYMPGPRAFSGETIALTKKTGFRKVELVQDNDGLGTSFYFRINNTDVFSGGSCWIPADSFASRIADSRIVIGSNLRPKGMGP